MIFPSISHRVSINAMGFFWRSMGDAGSFEIFIFGVSWLKGARMPPGRVLLFGLV
jgi:hypothetical protein